MTNTQQPKDDAQPSRECLHQSAAPEEFLEAPDVQDESGLSTHYSRSLVLECISAALQAAPPAPAAVAVPDDLKARCTEILEWQKTGILRGDALREFAAAKYPEHHEALQIAERATAKEAYAALAAAPAQAVAVPEGWRWMTHPDRNNGQPIPVRIEVEDGVTYYRPFDERGTDFEWDKRGDEWVEIAAPAQEHATQLAGQGQELPEAVIDAVAATLGDAYDCGRVWSAWGVGTMSQDDFHLVAEDGERVAEIARAAVDAYRAAQGEA